MKPTLEENAGVYSLFWEDFKIRGRVDRLKEDSRQNVSAEVLLRTDIPGTSSHLHQARLNLTSTTSRRSLARALEERLNTVDWSALIEQLCVLVLRRYREGEPVLIVGDIPIAERLKYRVEPLIVDKQPNLLYGKGGTGKSLLATFLAVLMDDAPASCGLKVEPGPVLYLDYETSSEEVRERITGIMAGLEQQRRSKVMYRFCFQRLADDIVEVQRIVNEHGIQMAIVDSVGPACGGEPESADVVLNYFRALRSLRITTLSVDHTNKEGHLFGSVYKFNASRSVFELKGSEEQDGLNIGLWHRKSNNTRRIKPLGFKVEFKEEAISFSQQDIRNLPDFAKDMVLQDRIAGVLKREPLSIEAIAEKLDVSSATIKTILNRFKSRFVRLPIPLQNAWALLETSAVTPP